MMLLICRYHIYHDPFLSKATGERVLKLYQSMKQHIEVEIQAPSHLDPSTIELDAIRGVGHTTQIIATMIYTKLGQNDEDGLE